MQAAQDRLQGHLRRLPTGRRRQTPRGAVEKICLEVLTNAMPDLGIARRVNDEIVRSCLVDEWFERVRPILTMEARRQRPSFDRAVISLTAHEFIGANSGVVWIIR